MTRIKRQTSAPALADGRGARATMAGAIIAAIAASACCILPAILAVVGISGLGIAAALEPYRPVLLGITAMLFALGFYLAYRRPRPHADVVSTDACGCSAPRSQRTGRAMLWLGALAVVLLATYPYVAGAWAQTEKRGDSVRTAKSKEVTLRIDGLTCSSCVPHIVDVLSSTPGVVKASVSYDDGLATVVYDPKRVQPEAFASAVTALDGYTAMVVRR